MAEMLNNNASTEWGRVIGLDDDSIWLETIQQSSCSSCSAKSGCGFGLMNEQRKGRRQQLKLDRKPQHQHLQLGDEVVLTLPDHTLVSTVLWVYLLPLFSMLLLAFLADYQGASELVTALFSMLGLALGFAIVAVKSKVIAKNVAASVSLSVSDTLSPCR